MSLIEGLAAPRTAAGLAEVLTAEEVLEASRAALADALFAVIGGLDDRELRGRLLQLRRDVHNGRSLTFERLAAVAPALPPDLHRDIESHRRRGEEVQAEIARLAVLYEDELAASRRRLQAAVADPDFQKGLLLSSRDLFAGIARYRRAPVERLGAKQRQIERGLLRYLTRMAMKTTPFGTFTALAVGRLAGVGGPVPLAFRGDPRVKRSVVRLNKRIYAVLRDELLADSDVRTHMPVALNPTLHLEGDHWRFLAAFGVREVFQKLPRNPVLDLFASLLTGGSLPLGELGRELVRRAEIEATTDEATAYIVRLLDIGFLRVQLGIGEQEANWDRPLAALLAPAGEAAAGKIRLLDQLRAARDAFVAAPVGRRLHLLDETTALMRETSERLFQQGPLRADVPFYEDSSTAASLEIPRRELAAAADELGAWARLTARLAWPRPEQAAMRHFFDGYYSTPSVPLLRFYEDYYREHFKEHLERQRRQMGGKPSPAEDAGGEEGEDEGDGDTEEFELLNPFGLEMVAAIKAATHALGRRLAERWRDAAPAPEISLTLADVEQAVAAVPEVRTACSSVSVFVQPLPGFARDGGTALFAGNLLCGFGKYFSRFLHVLPDELRAELAANNESLTDERIAEIGADGAFNANLHPPLLAWEIGYPTGDGGAAPGRLLATDLIVEAHPEDPHILCLRHFPTGHRVLALDLGFQNPRMRPPLFQLLSTFAPATSFGLPMPPAPARVDDPAAADAVAEAPRIDFRPRVRLGDHLILCRQRWGVPRALFPRRAAAEPDFEYFVRVQRWRRRHGIPREVFLSLFKSPSAAPPEAPAREGETAATADEPQPEPPRRRGHPYKPQYIDFDSPLLVDLFGRALENLDGFDAYLYERLPAREHLPAAGGERYVTEMVVQVDLRRDLSSAAAATVAEAADG